MLFMVYVSVCMSISIEIYSWVSVSKYIKHALKLKLNQAKCLISKKTIDTWVKCRDLNAKMRWKEVF